MNFRHVIRQELTDVSKQKFFENQIFKLLNVAQLYENLSDGAECY